MRLFNRVIKEKRQFSLSEAEISPNPGFAAIKIQKQNIGNAESDQKDKQEPSKNRRKRDENLRSTSGQRKDSKPKFSSRNGSKPKSIKSKQNSSSQTGGGRNRKSGNSGLVKRSK